MQKRKKIKIKIKNRIYFWGGDQHDNQRSLWFSSKLELGQARQELLLQDGGFKVHHNHM